LLPAQSPTTSGAAEKPLEALQKRARRAGFYVIRARNFDEYRDIAAGLCGDVILFDLAGNRLTGPLDIEAADAWLSDACRARVARAGSLVVVS
jgi:hypothetical protein